MHFKAIANLNPLANDFIQDSTQNNNDDKKCISQSLDTSKDLQNEVSISSSEIISSMGEISCTSGKSHVSYNLPESEDDEDGCSAYHALYNLHTRNANKI